MKMHTPQELLEKRLSETVKVINIEIERQFTSLESVIEIPFGRYSVLNKKNFEYFFVPLCDVLNRNGWDIRESNNCRYLLIKAKGA